MNNILTAEELFSKLNPQDGTLPKWAKDFAIAFTKQHVEACLNSANKDAKVNLAKDWIRKEETIHPHSLIDTIIVKVDKDSILNSYPLENIK